MIRGRAADAGRRAAMEHFGALIEQPDPEPQAGDGGLGVPDLGQGQRGTSSSCSTARQAGHIESQKRFGNEAEREAAEAESPTPVTHTNFVPREYRQSLPTPTTHLED